MSDLFQKHKSVFITKEALLSVIKKYIRKKNVVL